MFSSQKPYNTNVSDVPRSLQNWVSTIQTGRTHSWRFSICFINWYYTHRSYLQLTFFNVFLIEWNSSTNNSIQIEKGQIHSGITLKLNMFAMSESPKFRQITKKQILYVSKKGKNGWHCEPQHHIYLGARRRGTPVWQKQQLSSSTAAAQQQHSRSSSGGGGGGGGVEGGVGGGSTASLFCTAVAAAP